MMMTVSEELPSKKRKPYTHLACAGCKAKHIKCDGGKPSCQSCVSKKLECHYREERNMRRSSSKSQIKEEEFKDQLLQLQNEVEYWKSRYYTLIQLTQSNGIIGNLNRQPNQDEFAYPNPNPSLQQFKQTKSKKVSMMHKENHSEEIPNDDEYKPENTLKSITSKTPSSASYQSIPDRQKSYSYGDIPIFPSDHPNVSSNFVNSLQQPLLNPSMVRSRSQSQYEDNMIIDNNHFLSDSNRSNSVPHSMPQASSSYPYINRPIGVQQGIKGIRTTSVPVMDRFVDSFEDMMIPKQDNGYDSNHFSLLMDAKPVYDNKNTREDNSMTQLNELFKFQVNDYNMLYHSPIQGYIYREDYQGMGYMNNPSSIN